MYVGHQRKNFLPYMAVNKLVYFYGEDIKIKQNLHHLLSSLLPNDGLLKENVVRVERRTFHRGSLKKVHFDEIRRKLRGTVIISKQRK
jgi:hypothetical protein